VEKKIIPRDPFYSIDEVAVGVLIETAIQKCRAADPNIKVLILLFEGELNWKS
jgi:phosphoenolpyruvate synthase/pyruvate phosphate dikinase